MGQHDASPRGAPRAGRATLRDREPELRFIDAEGWWLLESLIQRYADHSGLDVCALSWYTALGYYKQAVICEVIHFRYAACQTVVASFDQIASIVEPPVSGAGTV